MKGINSQKQNSHFFWLLVFSFKRTVSWWVLRFASMAAGVDNSGEAVEAAKDNDLVVETAKSESKEFNVQNLVDMFTKLNPLAKEFFPSSFHHNQTKQTANFNQVPVKQSAGNENFSNKRVFFFHWSLTFSNCILLAMMGVC